jgi:long-subunit acyl-CoA synthetase (AMP-forming)
MLYAFFTASLCQPWTERPKFQAYPMSPRNSPQGVAYMLQSTSCTRIIAQESTASLVGQVRSDMELQGVKITIDHLPALKDVFPRFDDKLNSAQAEVEPYPSATQRGDSHQTALFIHSSGSTGYPKSVPSSSKRFLQWIDSSEL